MTEFLTKIFSHVLDWEKIPFTASLSALLTTVFYKVLLFFQAEAVWYYNPALMGLIGGLVVLVVGKVAENLLEKVKEKRKEQKDKELLHQTFAEKADELMYKERQDMINQLKEFHDTKIQFYREQIVAALINEYAARQGRHNYGNELNRVCAHTTLCHAILKDNDLTTPDGFKFKGYDEIMEGVEEKINAYAKQLKEEYAIEKRRIEEQKK